MGLQSGRSATAPDDDERFVGENSLRDDAPPPGEVELATAPPARAASVGAAALAERLKKLKSRREIEREFKRDSAVNSVAWSPDGKLVAESDSTLAASRRSVTSVRRQQLNVRMEHPRAILIDRAGPPRDAPVREAERDLRSFSTRRTSRTRRCCSRS